MERNELSTDKLKTYLSSKYQGDKSFLEKIIYPIFGEENFEDGFQTEILANEGSRRNMAEATGIESVKDLGKIYVATEPLIVFDITVSDHVKMERNRIGVQRLIRSIMDVYSFAFMIFHYEGKADWDWRFSYCHKGGGSKELTDGKRYTFLLGPRQSCRTAAENFMLLYDKRCSDPNFGVDDIENAFSVEALSKEFFSKYKHFYESFVKYMIESAGIRQDFVDRDFDRSNLKGDKVREREEKPIRDFVKKLMGRIVFLHFLQKKGWLGVPSNKEWGEGDSNFMLNLYKNATTEQQNDFLSKVLEPLFSEALDEDRSDRNDIFDTKVEGFRNVRIPYLNGGLFEKSGTLEKTCKFPSGLFGDLLEMLSQYNFTIDENDPNDAEVGVDPEMLGRIFENLLEDNKDKGAYYTPKEIVQYMCRESLIAYLQAGYSEEEGKDIRSFVMEHDASIIDKIKDDIDIKLKEVKICDPAIGSGAFPMGLLRELFQCRSAIEQDLESNAADIKRHIIQNNIYGVDIEKGAIDIARLRFWLSLVVDETSPVALPNLDFKIMQGNSLLEQYKGVDLSSLLSDLNEQGRQKEIFDAGVEVVSKQLSQKLADYYDSTNHELRKHLREDIVELVQKQVKEGNYNVSFDDIDIYENDKFFLWHTWFHDVFSRPSKEGFDIVIGNPPYIQLKWLKEKLIYKAQGYATFDTSGDIYCLFYELATNLMACHGSSIGTFITSNKWLRAEYGSKLRNFLLRKTSPKILINLGPGVFDAGVDTNILLWDNFSSSKSTLYANAFNEGVKNIKFTTQNFTEDSIWVEVSSQEAEIKRKTDLIHTNLSDFNVRLNYGILTGANDVFILDKETAQHLKSLDKKNEKIIKPLLRGQDIERYDAVFNNIYLLNLHNGVKSKNVPPINVLEYPSIKSYLESFGYEFKERGEQGDNWWNLRNCKYILDYAQPKILYSDIVQDRGKFYYDEDGYYTNDTAFMIIGENLKYLLAILNSTLFSYLYRKFYAGGGLGGHGLRFKREFLLKVPIPCADKKTTSDIEEIVNIINMLKKESHHSDISILENEIDSIVYRIYGMEEDDIKVIEA